jgi:hypothetical protein
LALLTFWAMRWYWEENHNSVLVAASVWSVIAACATLLVFFFRERRYKGLSEGALRMRLVLALLMLACDVPVVALYTVAPQWLTRRVTVTVINNGSTMIDRFVVGSAGAKANIGPVAPGATVTGTFYVPMNSWLTYEEYQTTAYGRSASGGGLSRKPQHTFTFTGNGTPFISE